MKRVNLTQRTARLLYDYITNNAEGYDYKDEQRIKWIKEKLLKAQGDYADTMAQIIRDEKAARRRCRVDMQQLNAAIALINYDVEDAIAEARTHKVSIKLEDADHSLAKMILASVPKTSAQDWMLDDMIELREALDKPDDLPDESIVVKEKPTGNGHVDEPDNLRELVTTGKKKR